jgi:hypothetical protein
MGLLILSEKEEPGQEVLKHLVLRGPQDFSEKAISLGVVTVDRFANVNVTTLFTDDKAEVHALHEVCQIIGDQIKVRRESNEMLETLLFGRPLRR